MLTLYSYYRSSASYRVRLALALKGLDASIVPIHLVRGGGEHKGPTYRAINPQARVPALKLDDDTVIPQSPAILEFLEEVYENPPLLPAGAIDRARVRAVMAIIVCDIHPLNNSGVLAKLRQDFSASEAMINAWIADWVTAGFSAIEELVEARPFCFGTKPTLADICLIPQLFAARRFSVPLESFPKILAIEQAFLALPGVAAAHPSNQPDAE